MQKINTEQFQELVYKFIDGEKQEFQGKLPCIVDFYADWCQPCKLITPALEQLAEEYKGKINVYKVNIEDENLLVDRYKIRSIPMVMFCPTDAEPQISQGALPKMAMENIVKEILLSE